MRYLISLLLCSALYAGRPSTDNAPIIWEVTFQAPVYGAAVIGTDSLTLSYIGDSTSIVNADIGTGFQVDDWYKFTESPCSTEIAFGNTDSGAIHIRFSVEDIVAGVYQKILEFTDAGFDNRILLRFRANSDSIMYLQEGADGQDYLQFKHGISADNDTSDIILWWYRGAMDSIVTGMFVDGSFISNSRFYTDGFDDDFDLVTLMAQYDGASPTKGWISYACFADFEGQTMTAAAESAWCIGQYNEFNNAMQPPDTTILGGTGSDTLKLGGTGSDTIKIGY